MLLVAKLISLFCSQASLMRGFWQLLLIMYSCELLALSVSGCSIFIIISIFSFPMVFIRVVGNWLLKRILFMLMFLNLDRGLKGLNLCTFNRFKTTVKLSTVWFLNFKSI